MSGAPVGADACRRLVETVAADLTAARVGANGRRRVFAPRVASSPVMSPSGLARLDLATATSWAAGRYPPGRYPVVAVGSAVSPLRPLLSALRAPWLPATTLLLTAAPRRWRGPRPTAGLLPALVRRLLERHADLTLVECSSPGRGPVRVRVRRQRLGPRYERFLADRLAPSGAVLVITDDAADGPWDALAEDVVRWARRHGHPVHRLSGSRPAAWSWLAGALLVGSPQSGAVQAGSPQSGSPQSGSLRPRASSDAGLAPGLPLERVERLVRAQGEAHGLRWRALWSEPASGAGRGPALDVGALPEQTLDDTDLGWGGRSGDGRDDEWYLRERPPHHGQ